MIKQGLLEVFLDNLNKRYKNDYEYVGNYVDSESFVTIKCLKCGTTYDRHAQFVRRDKATCKHCKRIRKEGEERENKRNKELRRYVLKNVIRMDSCLKEVYVIYCEGCRSLKVIDKNNKYCSSKCLERNKRRNKDKKRKELLKERTIDKGITKDKLIEKHNNECYLCGVRCDKNDYKIINNNFITGKTYPTIDHIISISNGGYHSWDNVALACFECNTNKGIK